MQHVFFIVLLVLISIWSNLDGVECGDGLEYWNSDTKMSQHAGRLPIDLKNEESYRRTMGANKKTNYHATSGYFAKIESKESNTARLTYYKGNKGKTKEKHKLGLSLPKNLEPVPIWMRFYGEACFHLQPYEMNAKSFPVTGLCSSTILLHAKYVAYDFGKETLNSVKLKVYKLILGFTRITPMPLMQQDEEEPTTKNYVNKESYVLEELNTHDLKQQMEKLLSNYQDVNSTVEVIGRSVEYNDIVLLKLTDGKKTRFRADDNKYVDEIPEKKVVFIVHGLSAMGLSNLPCLSGPNFVKLLEFYMKQLEYFDLFLIPLGNPDAVKKMYWNKNYSLQKACNGVMLDRNFDVSWNSSNTLNSCSQFFPGPSPFSEIETRVIRNVFHHYSHKIVAYFHVHAGEYTHNTLKGDAILYPKGYTDVVSDDDKYLDLKAEVDEAMRNASFRTASVQVETLHNWYGKISGSSVDYASSIYGIPYAMELVMQLYPPELEKAALQKIWGRVIDAIFLNIHKSTTTTNDV